MPGGAGLRRASTLNISSRGFYCLTDHPYSPGERLRCRIAMMPGSSPLGADSVYLDCIAEVVRVESADNAYGIGCRIIRYVLKRQASGSSGRKAASASGTIDIEA